jgi:hypothetical protein
MQTKVPLMTSHGTNADRQPVALGMPDFAFASTAELVRWQRQSTQAMELVHTQMQALADKVKQLDSRVAYLIVHRRPRVNPAV